MKKKAVLIFFVGALLSTLVGFAQTDDFYFWRLGHMDGPHDLSKALGISRDGKVARSNWTTTTPSTTPTL